MRCRATALVCLGFMLLFPGVMPAQDSQPTEYQLKAAFLFNFAKFVEWPTNAFSQKDAPFVIGIIGDNPFGKALDDTVRNKTVNEHPLQVKQFKSASEVTNQNCHILFISTSEKKRVKELIDGLRNAPLLTI